MSVASEITRIQGAKASIKSAIEAKGVTVPSNALLDSFATYIAQISGGGSTGLEYEAGTYTPSEDIVRPTISFSKTHNVPPAFVVMYDATQEFNTPANSTIGVIICDVYRLFGVGYEGSVSSYRYGIAFYNYRSSSSINTGNASFSTNSDATTDYSATYARYWITPTDFKPSSNSSSRYWRAGRTYKWIAVWK